MKKRSGTLRTVIIIILLLIIAFSGYKIITILSDYHDVTVANEEVREEYVSDWTEEGLPEVDFEKLQALNPDIVAWIYIPNTNVDFPVLKGSANESYLYHNYKREYSFAGSIFMDYRCSADFTDKETMLYGHNMHNGDMFGRLKKYQDTDYLKSHQDIYILLPGNEMLHYIAEVGGYVSVDDGIYYLPQPVDHSGDDPETLVLSTCTDDSSDTERFVVIANYEDRIES